MTRTNTLPTSPNIRLDDTFRDRFEEDLAHLIDPARDRVLVAVSGGADSIALLLLTQAILGDRCLAATVDHGLRPEGTSEAAFVSELCASLGVPHTILSAPLPARSANTANLSARARDLRYGLLGAHADMVEADWIATGHQCDDQCETLLMRLNRGSGVAGLAGIRPVADAIVRPLLGWRRTELAALVAAAGITPVDDPSNSDARFDRARLRQNLAEADWLDPEAVAASAAALADAHDALEWMAGRLADERIASDGDGCALDPGGLPFELVRRLTSRCLRLIEPGLIVRGSRIATLVSELARGEVVVIGRVRCAANGEIWDFRAAPPRRSAGPG